MTTPNKLTKTRPRRQADSSLLATWSEAKLRFSPTAWAKLIFLRDIGETEVGAFGITPYDDPLLVADLRFVRQTCTPISARFEDAAVAEFFDELVDQGLRPEQFARIWVHTHPGTCPLPSETDEHTFRRVFGCADWALMFILARGGQSYARLQFNVGPGGAVEISTAIDYSRPFGASDESAWTKEYADQVQVHRVLPDPARGSHSGGEPRMRMSAEQWRTCLWADDPLVADGPLEIERGINAHGGRTLRETS